MDFSKNGASAWEDSVINVGRWSKSNLDKSGWDDAREDYSIAESNDLPEDRDCETDYSTADISIIYGSEYEG